MRLAFIPVILSLLCMALVPVGLAQSSTPLVVGHMALDDSWEPVVYVSHIPSFGEMHYMSSKMIIAESRIDSSGYFELDLDFLPKAENLYRLHVVKKGNTPATLILGGKDENHLFFVLDGVTPVVLKSHSTHAPFKYVTFTASEQNNAIQAISKMVYQVDSAASESSASKRTLLEQQLQTDLVTIADTSSDLLVGLYAIYQSKFEPNYSADLRHYESFRAQWEGEDNSYFQAFSGRLPARNDQPVWMWVVLAALLGVGGFFLGKLGLGKNRKLNKLTIQERKVYELLLQSASNQEIADQLNIGLSTTKSHVSSIFSKLKVKSRKEIINQK